jgi:zinc D-Ala-D-Ala carboxypeptidase
MKATHYQLDLKSNTKLSKNFNSNEFVCSCGNCHSSFISEDLITKLQALREDYGKPIVITSGYRCPEHNRSIGGAKLSQHVLGNAVDIAGDDLDSLYKLAEKHFDAVGDGRPKGFIHVDTRGPRKRRWTY